MLLVIVFTSLAFIISVIKGSVNSNLKIWEIEGMYLELGIDKKQVIGYNRDRKLNERNYEMNLLEKAINETMNRMSEGQAATFLYEIGKMNPENVEFVIGRYPKGVTLMMVAFVEDQKVAECGVLALVGINEYYKKTYLTSEMRQAIKVTLNQHKSEIATA